MIYRIAIRGFLKDQKMFESVADHDEQGLERLVPDLAETHAEAMGTGQLDMIELEFLNDPDQAHRFVRIGTNAQRMVMPLEINLEGS
jgi:predicted urease superfamily metal-dependent hydrolase